jgi:hypothetical protein
MPWKAIASDGLFLRSSLLEKIALLRTVVWAITRLFG